MRQTLEHDEDGVVIAERYALKARLGRGATSRVYEAWDTLEHRPVALKLIRPYATEDKMRIEREIAALRILRLPSIAALLDHGTDGSDAFLILEFVPGLPFPGTPIPTSWEALAPRAELLLATLGRVHAAGIVHRDIKPANVLVTEDGSLGLLDFGLAWGAALGSGLTQDFVGTVAYAAPEQFLRSRVDARADLFSVGVMLFEALAGRLPWSEAEVLRLAGSRASTEPPPLRSFCPDVPAYACGLVDSLLRRLPEERPRSCAEALQLLRTSPDAEARLHRLPWLGSTNAIDMIEVVTVRGHSIDVSGPSGSGRSRLLREVAQRLESCGRRSVWVTPGTTPFESLARIAPLPTAGSDGYASMEANLRQRLGDETVLLVDDLVRVDHSTRRLLERIRSRRPIVRVVPNSGDIRLGPLSESALRALFHGPDRVLHLQEDGARELLARTSGLAGNVALETVAWVTGGVATWSDGRLRVARDGLDRLAVGLRTTVAPRTGDAPADRLEPQLRTLLAWASFAGEHASVELLARATGEPGWAVSMELEHLVELGNVTVEPSGAVRVLADAGVLAEWSDDRALGAHAFLASWLPTGAPGRLSHLLAAMDLRGAQEECEYSADALAQQGAAGRAFALLQIALGLARQLGTDTSSILTRMTALAIGLLSMRRLDQMLYELRRVDDTPEIRQTRGVLQAWQAMAQAEYGRARAIAESLGQLSDSRMEQLRSTVVFRAILALCPERMTAFLQDYEPRAKTSPEFYARWLGWSGHWQRSLGRFREAAALHAEAAASIGGTRSRHSHLLNAALCHVDALELDKARELATQGTVAARAALNPSFELQASIVLRDIAYRTNTASEPDFELVEAAMELTSPNDWIVCFVEAMIAARCGAVDIALELADRCREIGRKRNYLRAKVIGEVVVRMLGGERDLRDDELFIAIRRFPEPRLELQLLAMFCLTISPADAAAHLPRVEELTANLSEAERSAPLEMFSADTCVARVRAHVAG